MQVDCGKGFSFEMKHLTDFKNQVNIDRDDGYERYFFRPNQTALAMKRSLNVPDCHELNDSKKQCLDDSRQDTRDYLDDLEMRRLEELKPKVIKAKKRRTSKFFPTNEGGDDFGPTSVHHKCDINNILGCLKWHGYET